ncbi:hypothetical protein ACFQ21_22635 [Ohtaekwangia kribbensis]|jgi:phage host-nuclease inhibitor protein Gam|uniref:Uncharacterized protein n=1 Tax=Ohtaekwangia kribbensis TaxID=688913 RepID=A0ABW3K7V9_9BACT
MSRIRTHDDLVKERQRLLALLEEQKAQIKVDVRELKEELRPLYTLMSVVGKVTTRETRNDLLVNTGSSLAVDLLAGRVISKNPIARMFLPGVLKNVASHLIYNAKPFLQKLFSKKKKTAQPSDVLSH